VLVRLLTDENPGPLLLYRTADPHLQFAIGRHRRIQIHCDAAGRHQRPIDDEPQRPFFAVLAEEDDRPHKVLVHELGHGQQQGRRQRTHRLSI
jgi:hypothetical protein